MARLKHLPQPVAAGATPAPGTTFPDLERPDHTGRTRTLSEIAGGDPLVRLTSRGWRDELALRAVTDTVHDPYRPAAFTLFSDLRFHRAYNGVATHPGALVDVPHARIFPGKVVRSDLFARVPAPPGPAIERSSGATWPGGSFATGGTP